ncbi:Sulfite reductase [NADPH] hemoprotein beta-component [Candidatus Nasuia deltocephalinicola]|nr:Sulfite reductase [NADPH] hemoprotein beta-component [Candidatus Nasuia deltocephalinicola]
MYIYNNNEKIILYNRYLFFKKQLIFYLIGKLSENEFKVFRLQKGIYRQKISYMYRILIPYGFFSFKQSYMISYIIYKFDKKYLHFTTRTNIQLNWFKIIDSFYLIFYLLFVCLNSIQTSGNCVRNITVNYDIFFKNYIDNKSWCELIKQWFYLNSEFLFLPRKFKISITSSKIDNSFIKINDLGLFIKKNLTNNLLIDFFVGGGLGRTPLRGLSFIKNIHWKNILNYCNTIIKIYNINGYRDNIYKARIKIFIKFISLNKFYFFIKNEIYFSNKNLYILNEKEINKFYLCIYDKKNYNIINYPFLIKKIKYNIFFSDWLILNIEPFKDYIINITLLIKWFNSPPGDINYIQLKILFYIFTIINCNYFFINNRQNIILESKNIYIYNLYINLKYFFFFIYNINSIFNIVSCPGKDFCSLANSESISLSIFLQNLFLDYNTIIKLNFFNINISGCINSCAHHHISNLGFLGLKKNEISYYQFLIGGDNNFNNLLFSNILGPSLSFESILLNFIKFLKKYLKIKKNNEFFIDTYNKFGFIFFKNYIYNND